MPDSSEFTEDLLRQQLRVAGLDLTPEEIERLLPAWKTHMEWWAAVKDEDLGETVPDLLFTPPVVGQ